MQDALDVERRPAVKCLALQPDRFDVRPREVFPELHPVADDVKGHSIFCGWIIGCFATISGEEFVRTIIVTKIDEAAKLSAQIARAVAESRLVEVEHAGYPPRGTATLDGQVAWLVVAMDVDVRPSARRK